MKRGILSICTSLIVTFIPGNLFAAGDSAWITDKAKLERLVSEGKCDQYWNLLWPWAKKGNLEARGALFMISAVQLHVPEVYPPGRSGDIISHLRDIMILMIHGLPEATVNHAEQKEQIFIEQSFINELRNTSRAKNFLKCWEENRSQACSDIAVKDKLIPSWESYAAEIDAILESGAHSTCIKHKHD